MNVPRIARGGVISYRYLRGLEDAIIDSGRRPGAPATTAQAQVDDAEATNLRPDQAFDGRTQRTAGRVDVSGADVYRETARTTATVRVENPDDAEQYVDVERVEAVAFVDGLGRVLTLAFDNA